MLRKTRTILASFFYVGITLLFLDFTGTLRLWLGWMAKIQFLPALLAFNVLVVIALIALTLIFGRIYCSVICPLGVMQDIIAHIGRKGRKLPYKPSKAKCWLRYSFLGVFIIALITGVGSVVALLAPYSSFGRIVSNLLQPIYLWCNNLLATIAEHYNSYAFYSTDVWIKSLPTFVIAIFTLSLIGILAWRNGRTYCNTVCPVGTVLGFLSRFSLLKVYIDTEKCRNCSKCSRHCKAACIDSKAHKIDYSRCIVCGNCLGACEWGALKYGRIPTKQTIYQNADKESVDQHKRMFLLTSTSIATTATLAQSIKKVDGGLAEIEDKLIPKRSTLLTPPGSLSAKNMAHHCTGCQLCVSECPNGVLRPSIDITRFMQPTMSYERGFCRPECTRCSEVCPTGAITPLTREEKTSTQIGHAVWIHFNCIAVTDRVECGNCARHCPAGAIEMIPYELEDEEEVFIPSIDESRCIGCGACENLCPARPFPAIYVEGHEVHKEV